MLTGKKSNKRVKTIFTVLLILIIGAGVFLWINQSPSIPNISKLDTVKQDITVKKTALKQNKKGGKNTTPKNNTVKPILIKQQTASNELASLIGGNFGKLNALRSQADELELELKIVELQARKREITGKGIILKDNSISQNLVLPPIISPEKLPKSPNLANVILPVIPYKKVASSIAVVEISGVNNNLFAIIRMKNNSLIKVRQGQRFNRGIIKNISRQGVIVQYSPQNNINLPFE